MIWLNPWAWLGIAGVALPIVIHLLGRGHARVIKFPSLRFLDASRLLPTRRSRVQDPLLLAVRVAIVGLAALALAQPLLLTTERKQALDRGLARALIVDTSASMLRRTANRTLMDSARVIATQLAAGAQTSIAVETGDPATAVSGAIAWLARQGRRGELVLLSDFQRGQIERADLAGVPSSVGIVLRQLTPASADTVRSRALAVGRTSEARVRATATGADIEWLPSTATDSVNVPLELLAGPGDGSALTALRAAVATVAVPLPIDTSRSIAVLFAHYPSRDAIVASLRPPHAAWALALLAQARRGALPMAAAGEATIDGKRRFVLATNAEPASVDAATLVSLARRATSSAPPAYERQLATVSDAELRTWERPAQESSPAQHRPLDDAGPSDGRWLWALVLALLLVEWRLRRPRPTADASREEHARAA